MVRNLSVLCLAAMVVALPFVLRQPEPAGDWQTGDPVLTIVTPHNEAIRYEFGRSFSAWHKKRFGAPVKIEWLNIGGTTEISRYLTSEYVAAFRAWWTAQAKPWPAGAGDGLLARPTGKPDDPFADLRQAFRVTDDPGAFGVRIDLFFGGGEYDHTGAAQQGLTVPPWPAGHEPTALLAQIPERLSGEIWRTKTFIGTTVSTFGICYNRDRLRDLGVPHPPTRWLDLAEPVYFRQLGIADPTKSGSIAKAFEMIIQQRCHDAVRSAGFSEEQIDTFETRGQWPAEYQACVEQGWEWGLHLIQLIGANARYFTESASKVPVDVAAGDAAVGLAIDFYARFQAQVSGAGRMEYVTPVGGSSVSCDPISLLRGAPNRPVAVRFIEFVLSEDGQRLWNDQPGRPCSHVEKYALRRLPIRRDFYPPHREWQPCTTDDLADPAIDPYALAVAFTYRPRWTARQFNVQRDLVRAMCLDSADELRAAWGAIIAHGGPAEQPEAMRLLARLPDRPEPLTWTSAREVAGKYERLEYLREWTEFFRRSYREAEKAVVVGHASRVSRVEGAEQRTDTRDAYPTPATELRKDTRDAYPTMGS